MDRSVLRRLIFDALRKNPQTHVHAIENEIRQVAEEYERHDVLSLHEIVWDLLVQGILAPGKNSLNLNLPFVHVTEAGAAYLDDGTIEVYDPEGYVARLAAQTEHRISLSVMAEAREALLCFLAGRYAASLSMLARGVEALFDEILVAAGTQVTDPLAPCDRRGVVANALGCANLPAETAEHVTVCLDDLHAIVRTLRDPSSRPKVATLNRDTVLARLLMFPNQCRIAYDVIALLHSTPGRTP